MMQMDQYAYINELRFIHPMEKFAFSLITLLIALWSKSWLLHISVITFMTFLILFFARIPIKVYLSLMVLPIGFLMIGVLGMLITITRDNSLLVYGWHMGDWIIGVGKQGLEQIPLIFFRAYASVVCLYFLALTTPMVDIIWVLRKWKVPTVITELMTLMYRFIFVLIEAASLIYITQQCRLGYSSMRRSYHSLGGLISNLFLKTFYRSKELFVALTARGYTGDLLVLEEDYCLSKRNIIGMIVFEMLLMLIA